MEEEIKKGKSNPAKEEDLEDEVDDDEEIDDEDIEDDDPEQEDDEDNEDEEEDDEETEKKKKEELEKKKKAEMDKQERSRQAQARREREAKKREEENKRIEKSAFLKGKLEATKVNTFTNEPIDDEYDLKVFELQKKIEKRGGDPIADLPRELANLDREEGEKVRASEKAKKESEDFISNDIKEFREKNPDVNLKELLHDEDFKDYTEGRLGIKGGQSLDTLYKNFLKFKSKYGSAKKDKEKEEADDGKRGAPTPNGGGKQKQTSYSKLSDEDKLKELKRQGLI